MPLASSPFFLTGSTAKIQVNGVTLAFATNISYSVKIPHANPKVLGMYESDSMEPLSYDVDGQLTVIRYMKNAKSMTSALDANVNGFVSEDGKGLGNWGKSRFDGRAYEAADPATFKKASSFDIVIYQKINSPENIVVAKIRNTRINGFSMSITKNQPALQTFSFQAQYLDEDSFLSNYSGSLG